MTRHKTYFRLVFLVVAVSLLISLIGLVACAKPPAAAPSPTTSPKPVTAPAPRPAPAPSSQLIEDKDETAANIPGSPVLAQHYWGYVATSTGEPAVVVEVTAWINGKLRGSVTTDADGRYGTNPLAGFPHYLVVTGQGGDVIEFRVDGVVAEEAGLGVLEEGKEKYFWQWLELQPEWQAIYAAGEVNGLNLIYTPTG